LPKHPKPGYQSPYADPADTVTPTEPTAPVNELSPLTIILSTMRQKYADGDIDGAVALARIAAPYLHPRIPATIPPSDLAAMPDADLDALRRQT
jgi:hypothetical protein